MAASAPAAPSSGSAAVAPPAAATRAKTRRLISRCGGFGTGASCGLWVISGSRAGAGHPDGRAPMIATGSSPCTGGDDGAGPDDAALVAGAHTRGSQPYGRAASGQAPEPRRTSRRVSSRILVSSQGDQLEM